MQWREFFIVLALVAVVVVVLSRTGPETSDSPTPAVAKVPGKLAVTLDVAGRPERLDDLRIKFTLTSPHPIELPLCDGLPVGTLNIGTPGKRTDSGKRYYPGKSFEFVHASMLVDGRVPGTGQKLKRRDEVKLVEEYTWEVEGRDLFSEYGSQAVETIDGVFLQKISIDFHTWFKRKNSTAGSDKWKGVSGNTTLPAVR